MEWLIVTIVVFVFFVACLLYFSSRTSPADRVKPARRRADTSRVMPKPQSFTTKETQPQPAADIDMIDQGLPQLLDGLKDQIQTRMAPLFPSEENWEGIEKTKPLNYEDVGRPILDTVMGHIDAIHNFRSTHQRLQQILNDPALNVVSALSSVITSDPVLSAKVLKIVNSAYFGRAQKVNSIGHALFLLGMVQLREILYRDGLLEIMKVNDPRKDELIGIFWQHATITSICASHLRILFPGLDQGTLFTTGLIHDVGKLILVRMSDGTDYTPQSTILDEDRIFGVNHAVIGRMALEKWGFSDMMTSVVTNHHSPSHAALGAMKLSGEAPQYLMALFLANQLAKMIQPGDNYLPVAPLHPSYHFLIHREAFNKAALDSKLLNQVSKSEVFIT
ncbi:MAG: hypothetical protein CSYNP_03376 [Syntrophus sp. SKADARSKE-3]|nr:hypothetical protein [Syntrophus sp. SKADARSKE-3]